MRPLLLLLHLHLLRSLILAPLLFPPSSSSSITPNSLSTASVSSLASFALASSSSVSLSPSPFLRFYSSDASSFLSIVAPHQKQQQQQRQEGSGSESAIKNRKGDSSSHIRLSDWRKRTTTKKKKNKLLRKSLSQLSHHLRMPQDSLMTLRNLAMFEREFLDTARRKWFQLAAPFLCT